MSEPSPPTAPPTSPSTEPPTSPQTAPPALPRAAEAASGVLVIRPGLWALAFVRVLLRMTWIEIKLLIREPVTLVFSFAFPVLVLVLLGGIFGGQRMDSGAYAGLKMMDWYVPSYIGLVVASIGTVSLPVHLSTYRERGVLRRFRASGVSEWVLLGSQFLVGVCTCLVGALFVSVLGIFAYGVVAPVSVGGVAVAFVVAVFAFSAVGVLIASLAPTARAAQGVGLLIWFIMMFISGTSAPFDQLPHWMVTLARALPLYHVVISLVDPWNGRGTNFLQLTIVGGIGLATTLLATGLFQWE
jgi:ABC-2 type transport system permease protein